MFHKQVLNNEQLELLPLLKQFKREYYLVGGTAIALYIGHRRSIDFDLFKYSALNRMRNLNKISNKGYQYVLTRNVEEQQNLIVNGVKLTFCQYPFEIEQANSFEDVIKLPSLLDLSAMKAYALGRRSKWKDYVDLCILIDRYVSFKDICDRAYEIYGQMFSEKLFRSQLSYFDDIDYTEEVEWMMPYKTDDEIKAFLTEVSVQLN